MKQTIAYAISFLVCFGCLAQQASTLAVVEAVGPIYPPLAVIGRVSGSVLVDVQVNERGAVAGATVAEGDALLRQASLDAANQWRFQAQPGNHRVTLIFSYRLMPKDTPEAQFGTIFRPPYTVEVRKISPGPVSHFARAVPR